MKYSKFYIFTFYLLFIILVIINQEVIVEWIRSEGREGLPYLFLGAVLLAAVPFIPFGIVGAIVGAKYGLLLGGVLNLAASSIAALLTYFLFYFLFRQQSIAYLMKSERIQSIERSIKNYTFWSVFVGRLIPIMPAFLINCYAGTFKLAFKPFLLATVLGKIPAMLVFAYAGDNALSGAKQWIAVLLLYCIFITIVYLIYKSYRKKLN